MGYELQTENQEVQVCSQTDRALLAGTEKVLVILNNYSINVTLFISVAEWAGREEDEPCHPPLQEFRTAHSHTVELGCYTSPRSKTIHLASLTTLEISGDLNGPFSSNI